MSTFEMVGPFMLGLFFGAIVGLFAASWDYKLAERKKNKALKDSEKGFKIILSEGWYDVFFDGIRITSFIEREDAMSWLEAHRNEYSKKYKVIYEE